MGKTYTRRESNQQRDKRFKRERERMEILHRRRQDKAERRQRRLETIPNPLS